LTFYLPIRKLYEFRLATGNKMNAGRANVLPFTAHFNTEEDTLYWKWKGRVTGEDFLRAIKEAAEFPGFRPGAPIVSDFTEADHLLSTDILIRALDLLAIYRQQYGNSRVAILVSNLKDYGLATMFSLIATVTPLRARVFMDLDRAQVWLSMPREDNKAANF
jgi:hypothetical protein